MQEKKTTFKIFKLFDQEYFILNGFAIIAKYTFQNKLVTYL